MTKLFSNFFKNRDEAIENFKFLDNNPDTGFVVYLSHNHDYDNYNVSVFSLDSEDEKIKKGVFD